MIARLLWFILAALLAIAGCLIFYFVCGQPGDQIGAALLSGSLIGIGCAIVMAVLIS